jgi:hypothetical protein
MTTQRDNTARVLWALSISSDAQTCAIKKTMPSSTPGAQPKSKIRASTSRAVDRSFYTHQRKTTALDSRTEERGSLNCSLCADTRGHTSREIHSGQLKQWLPDDLLYSARAPRIKLGRSRAKCAQHPEQRPP